MSYADKVFIENCRSIIDNGVWDTDRPVRPKWADDLSPAHTIKKFGMVNRYNLAEEFPIQTLRYINFKAAVDEILWIWQKKSNRIADLGSKIWDAWADENGTIGVPSFIDGWSTRACRLLRLSVLLSLSIFVATTIYGIDAAFIYSIIITSSSVGPTLESTS